MLEIFNILITIILLIVIVHYNRGAQQDVKLGGEVIVNNPSGYCPPEIGDIGYINKSDLTPCNPQPDFFIYKIDSKNVTNYILSTTQTVFYKNVCDTLIGQEKTNCIKLLKPPEGCSNSSNPFGTIGDTFYYAVGVFKGDGAYPFCLTPA